jgi:hypothetical protein
MAAHPDVGSKQRGEDHDAAGIARSRFPNDLPVWLASVESGHSPNSA